MRDPLHAIERVVIVATQHRIGIDECWPGVPARRPASGEARAVVPCLSYPILPLPIRKSSVNFGLPLLLGVLAGAAFCFAVHRWCRRHENAIYCAALVYIAAVYVGPALSRGAPGDVLEILASGGFFGLAIAGLAGGEAWLAAGYILHGMWDAFHVDLTHTALPKWYAPMCIGFDWAVGVWILRWMKQKRAAAA